MNWKPSDIAMVRAIAGPNGGGGGGVTPNIQATAETLPAGSEATVTRTGSNTNPVFHFGIPEGAQGTPGAAGLRGPKGEQGDPGKDATINGKNAIALAPGQNVTIETGDDGTVTISAAGGGAGESVTAGDGLSKDGDILSVNIPVRDLTQAEYDALPDAQKAKGLVFLPDDIADGEISIDTDNKYSTEERRVGTWIDGKPLYRKIVTSNRNVETNDYLIAENVDTFVYGVGTATSTVGTIRGKVIGLPNYVSASDAVYFWLENGNLILKEAGYSNYIITMIVNYTKTTD